ncbi:hypothetical protein BGZ65_002518 [Modicella reniformis]|uniref:Transmembrane protein n=1 Tax=Modicella reniformis TaxID=1440133 RepID=A0A9P6J0I2_9FUNG|nr:hypothetical protein BGZ65_002518 [Modicella reniformis]
MSILFGRKTAGTKLSSINYARGLVVALYLCSWLFSIMAAMLVQTNNWNLISCELSMFTCIVLYAESKIIIYLFLIERVHIVTAVGVTRWNSFMFKFNTILLSPYIAIFVLAIVYRVAKIMPDGTCHIGLLRPAAVPFIVYDIFISCWLTVLFLKALLSSTSLLQGPTKSKLRDVARRTLLGSLFSLVLSCANISTLVYYAGEERGLMCLATCTVDVTLNAITIHWVTSRSHANSSRGNSTNIERSSSPRGPNFGLEKQVSPLESHISVSIESYVEEYHQLNVANKYPAATAQFNHIAAPTTSQYNHANHATASTSQYNHAAASTSQYNHIE